MSKKIITFAIILVTIMGTCGLLIAARAQTSIISTSNTHYAHGDYTVDDFIILAIRVSKMIMGIVGSLSLIMLIYGGFMFLISAGSSESITKARKIIVAAIIGLVIVFSSYLIIKFVLGAIGIDWNGDKITVALAPAAPTVVIRS